MSSNNKKKSSSNPKEAKPYDTENDKPKTFIDRGIDFISTGSQQPGGHSSFHSGPVIKNEKPSYLEKLFSKKW